MASTGEAGGEAPIIRVMRRKKGEAGHHGGAWKVAYADFVTAMMAFFLVMWIIGLDQPTRKAIAAYFNNPTQFNKGGGKHPLGSADVPPKTMLAPVLAKKSDNALIEAQFKAKANEILKDLEKTPEFRGLRDSVQVHLTNEGLRIELMEKTSSLFFATGSARLNPRTVRLLQLIAQELKGMKNPIIVEGHTDSRPLDGANGYSNWELSADRANAARRAMEEHGLHAGQIIGVRAYADRKLLRPEEPTHPSNRRVSILVAYTGSGE
jgi:chemotaxis protein MotB